MFKLLTLGVLFYFLYRLVFRSNLLEAASKKEETININKNRTIPDEEDDGDYIDYEEVD